jgi:hypothetical protein
MATGQTNMAQKSSSNAIQKMKNQNQKQNRKFQVFSNLTKLLTMSNSMMFDVELQMQIHIM